MAHPRVSPRVTSVLVPPTSSSFSASQEFASLRLEQLGVDAGIWGDAPALVFYPFGAESPWIIPARPRDEGTQGQGVLVSPTSWWLFSGFLPRFCIPGVQRNLMLEFGAMLLGWCLIPLDHHSSSQG